MTSRIARSFSPFILAAAGILTLASTGCGSAGVAWRSTTSDPRSDVVVGSETPRLVVAGPALLLHIDVAGAGNATLYRVALNGDGDDEGDVSCRSGARIAPVLLRGEGTKRLSLNVEARQAVCVIADRDVRGHGVEVVWHVRRPASLRSDGLAQGLLQTSNRPHLASR